MKTLKHKLLSMDREVDVTPSMDEKAQMVVNNILKLDNMPRQISIPYRRRLTPTYSEILERNYNMYPGISKEQLQDKTYLENCLLLQKYSPVLVDKLNDEELANITNSLDEIKKNLKEKK